MDIQSNNTTLLGLFFLYLIMMSSNINTLLACNVQRLLDNSIFIKHAIVYFSIFIFTFILGWFLPSAIIVGDKKNNILHDKSIVDDSSNNNYIIDSVIKSVFIYVLFVLSAKQSVFFMGTFIILLLALIFIYLFYTKLLDELNINRNAITSFFVSKTSLESLTMNKDVNPLFILHNSISLGHIVILLNILFGVFYYYKKQVVDHKDWSWVKFIFGVNKCNK